MAANIRFVDQGPSKTLDWRMIEITFDSAYPTGGYPLAPADVDMAKIVGVTCLPANGYTFDYDYANSKLKCWRTASHTHTENTAAAYTQNASTASSGAGPMSEVPNNTNLSTVTCRALVWGYPK